MPRKRNLRHVVLCEGLLLLLLTSVSLAQSKKGESPATPPVDTQGSPSANQASAAAGAKDTKASKQSGSEKARLILDQAYQLALNTKPVVKAEALAQIADTMKVVDKQKAASIYRVAFEAAQEIPVDEKQVNRAAIQSRMAIGLADIDPEAAMELATRVDMPVQVETVDFMSLFSKGSQNFHAQAIQQVAMKVAEKDPSRAMILILPTLRERDFPYEIIAPLLGKLVKNNPDQAQVLFNDLLQQFNVSTPSFLQLASFPALIRMISDLDRPLALQAINSVLSKIPQAEESIKSKFEEEGKKAGQPPMPMPFSLGAIPKTMLISLLKKLDPERALALEKEIAPEMEQMDKMTGGSFSKLLSLSDIDVNDSPEKQQQKILDRFDPGQFPESQRSMMGYGMSVQMAQVSPQKALDFSKYVTDDKQKAMALAAIAGGFASSDKEKARSILSDAATLAEKIKTKEDRAIVFTMLGESAQKIDRELAKGLYGAAFESYGQAFDLFSQAVSSEKERTDNQNKTQQLSQRYSRAVAGYATVDFDDAVERAKQIGDDRERLMTLIRLATRVLDHDRTIPPMQYLGPEMPFRMN